jgi:hypothetical protein
VAGFDDANDAVDFCMTTTTMLVVATVSKR